MSAFGFPRALVVCLGLVVLGGLSPVSATKCANFTSRAACTWGSEYDLAANGYICTSLKEFQLKKILWQIPFFSKEQQCSSSPPTGWSKCASSDCPDYSASGCESGSCSTEQVASIKALAKDPKVVALAKILETCNKISKAADCTGNCECVGDGYTCGIKMSTVLTTLGAKASNQMPLAYRCNQQHKDESMINCSANKIPLCTETPCTCGNCNAGCMLMFANNQPDSKAFCVVNDKHGKDAFCSTASSATGGSTVNAATGGSTVSAATGTAVSPTFQITGGVPVFAMLLWTCFI